MANNAHSPTNWSELKLFEPHFDWLPPPQCSREEALLFLKEILSQKQGRLHSLANFLDTNGLSLSRRKTDLTDISVFYFERVSIGMFEGEEGRLWREFVAGSGLFLGDIVIDQRSDGSARWGVKDIALRGGTPRYFPHVYVTGGSSMQKISPFHYLLDTPNLKQEFPEIVGPDVFGTILGNAKSWGVSP